MWEMGKRSTSSVCSTGLMLVISTAGVRASLQEVLRATLSEGGPAH